MKETKKKNTPKKQASKQSFFKGVKSELKKVKWPESSLPKVYQAINEKVNPEQPVKINGIRANFVLSCFVFILEPPKHIMDSK